MSGIKVPAQPKYVDRPTIGFDSFILRHRTIRFDGKIYFSSTPSLGTCAKNLLAALEPCRD